MEPAERLLGPSGREMLVGAARQAALDADRAGDVFLLEHAFLDQAEGLLPVRCPVGAGTFGGDQHAVHPAQPTRGHRVQRDEAQVVGMEDGDRVRKDDVAGRDELAERFAIGRRRRFARTIFLLRPGLAGAARDQRLDVLPEAHGRGQAIGEERIDRVLVQHADVISLEERVDDQLPVGRVLGRDAAKVHQRVDAEERHLAVEAAEMRGDVDRHARRRHDPEQAVPLFAWQRNEVLGVGAAVAVERIGMQAMTQHAVELVGPAVVRADDARARFRLARLRDEAHAAMPADVEEGAKATVAVAREQHRHVVVVVGHHLAGLQLAGVAADQRQGPEQAVDLGVANGFAGVVLDGIVEGLLGRLLPFEAAALHLRADARELRGERGREAHRIGGESAILCLARRPRQRAAAQSPPPFQPRATPS